MFNQMVRQKRPAAYRLVGEGPIGFSVIDMPPSGVPPSFAEKLSRWKNQPRTTVITPEVTALFGEFARLQDWAKLSEVAAMADLSLHTLIKSFGQREELAEGLFTIQQDLTPDAIGGYHFVGDLWHVGHTRDFLNEREAYVPYEWALRLLAKVERRKAVESAPAG